MLIFWPGIASFDTAVQYQQVLSASYDDWHPPIMARLWTALSFTGPGTSPLFIAQMAAYWFGLALLAHAIGGRRAVALLAIGATPFLLGWLAIVIKDSQMIGALSLATGLIAHYRLRDRPMPIPALAIAILCLTYATLVRANAVFSTVPLAMLLIPRPTGTIARFLTMIAAIPAILLLSQPINHGLLGARDSGVTRTQPLYDLAGIAVRTGDPSVGGLPPSAIQTLIQHHCVKPLFWDPIGNSPACEATTKAWQKRPVSQLYADLAKAALRHPFAYLAHRFAHLNSTERWLVPLHWPLAGPPAMAEPNNLGLANPACCAAIRWQGIAARLVETPLAWPILWVAAALWGLWLATSETDSPQRRLALALFLSALFQEASFAAISISSDLRYHLWAMFATALGWLILRPRRPWLRRTMPGALAIAALLITGTIARIALPPPPTRYADLMN
nr:hypothetical protein [Sphingobium sp. EM0848]